MKIRCLRQYYAAFSFPELLAVVAIVSILAGYAIVSYTSYLTETKIDSMWHQAEAAKIEVESQYYKANTAVSSITVDSGTTEYTTTTDPDYIKCITVQSGIVSVVGIPAQFNSLNIWVSWTPTVTSGALTWACHYSSDAAQYISDSSENCSVGTASYSGDSAC